MTQFAPAGWRRYVRTGERVQSVVIEHADGPQVQVQVDGTPHRLDVRPNHVLEGSQSHTLEPEVDDRGTLVAMWVDGHRVAVELLRGPARLTGGLAAQGGAVRSPMNGQVVKIPVAVQQPVSAGDCVVVLEAMKMENEVRAPLGGRLVRLDVEVGQNVASGQILFEIEGATP